ncbi:MAG: glycosyltransferase family 2 protein [Planctomycetota bacterium]
MTDPLLLSVVIPAYNEEENLRVHAPRILEALRRHAPGFEVLVVDDGSTDESAAVAESLAAAEPRVRVLRHGENRGPGSGVFTGIAAARGEFVMFLPADVAIDLEQLPRYIEAARGADVVVGIRSDRRDYTLFRKFVSVVNIALIRFLFRMRERQFNYVHLYRRRIFDHFTVDSRGVFITAEILIRARDCGFRLTEVEIAYVPREFGTATCGRVRVIARTVRDLIRFWILRTFLRGRYRASFKRKVSA